MNTITSPQTEAFYKALTQNKSLLIEELWNSPKAALLAVAAEATKKNIIILSGQSTEELKLFHDFAFFTNIRVVDFPAWETLPNEEIAPSPDIVGERYQVLKDLQIGRAHV